MKFTIRKAVLTDLHELKNLFFDTITETCKNDYSSNERKVWANAVTKTEKWKKSLENEYFIVALNQGIIVGFSSLKNQNYLNLMYIHKDYTRKGIATLLYEKIKAKSIEYGCEKLTADVSKTARPFFEIKGFKVIQENKNCIENEIVINYKMSE